ERMTPYLFRPEKKAEVEHLLALLPDRWPHLEYSKSEAAWTEVEKKLEPRISRSPEGLIALRLPESLEKPMADFCRQAGLKESDLTHPLNPKYARLLDLAGAYLEAGGNQLVFTEEKGEHVKLRRLLAWNLRLPLGRIGIINADEAAGGRLDRLLRDYSRGELRLVVANRKAELGLNLQTGTTAIHHLSLPWTPASLYQRNGRGLRQGNQEEMVRIHYYVGEKTFDSYRRTILEAKAGWINELLNGQMPTMGHDLELSLEEQLDLLAASPEEAQARREKRRLAARPEPRKKKRECLFNALRQLTCLAARNSRNDQRLKDEIGQIELRRQKLSVSLWDMETGIRSPANVRREYLRYINAELKEWKKLRDKRLESEDSEEEAPVEAEESESFWVESSSRITALQKLKTPPEMADWAAKARELYTEDLTRSEALALELEKRRLKLKERARAGLEQTWHYLRRVQETEGLPFPPELLDRLDSFLVTPKNKILKFGQFHIREGLGLKIISIAPGSRQAVADVFDPAAGKTRKTLKLDALEDCREAGLDEFMLGRSWRYGLIHKLDLPDREFWDRHAQWLKFDLDFGAVYRLEDRLIPVWNRNHPPPPGATPAWPEPQEAEFRRQVCQKYLEDGDQANRQLMADLFGEGFEVLARNLVPGREAGFSRDQGDLWEKIRRTLTPGQADDEELIRKIHDLLKHKSRRG
ncbi:MAG: hypothetical protein LBC90_03190, partial [Candidatus Adiutrix sp.]|nr:hypothetical protein [Candidatus Adiutrix sp.]